MSESSASRISPRERLPNRTLNPLLEDLPPQFVSFRPHQITAVNQILRAFEMGARCVVLDAPTGSGKTLIAEAVRRMLRVETAAYVCSGKELQKQFEGDFPYSYLLMGRANYPTLNFADSFHPEAYIGHISAE